MQEQDMRTSQIPYTNLPQNQHKIKLQNKSIGLQYSESNTNVTQQRKFAIQK